MSVAVENQCPAKASLVLQHKRFKNEDTDAREATMLPNLVCGMRVRGSHPMSYSRFQGG